MLGRFDILGLLAFWPTAFRFSGLVDERIPMNFVIVRLLFSISLVHLIRQIRLAEPVRFNQINELDFAACYCGSQHAPSTHRARACELTAAAAHSQTFFEQKAMAASECLNEL